MEIPDQDINTLIWWLILRDLLSACPHTQFNTTWPLRQWGCIVKLPNLMHACHAGKQFVPNLWLSLVRIDCGTNPLHTAWETDMLTNVMWWRIFRFNTSIMVLVTWIIWDESTFITNLICVAAFSLPQHVSWPSFLYIMTYNIKIRQKLSNKFGHLLEKVLHCLRNKELFA